MFPKQLLFFAHFVFTLSLCLTAFACESSKPFTPQGAVSVNATDLQYSFCPSIEDISMSGKGVAKLYNGLYFTGPRDASLYEMDGDNLVLNLKGAIAAIQTTGDSGALPLLNGSKPFYIAVKASLSENDSDHWPAIWLMPIEHTQKFQDVYDSSRPGFEEWLEVDIDEGGFGPGSHNTAISWQGKWPNYTKIQNPSTTSKVALDRTEPHTFGVSYNPSTLTIQWWLDDQLINTATSPYVPKVALKQNFYLILSAQSHKLQKPYKFKIYEINAYSGK